MIEWIRRKGVWSDAMNRQRLNPHVLRDIGHRRPRRVDPLCLRLPLKRRSHMIYICMWQNSVGSLSAARPITAEEAAASAPLTAFCLIHYRTILIKVHHLKTYTRDCIWSHLSWTSLLDARITNKLIVGVYPDVIPLTQDRPAVCRRRWHPFDTQRAQIHSVRRSPLYQILQ